MSEREHTITLSLNEASTEQLQAAYDDAMEMSRRCEKQGSFWHTWGSRAKAIGVELEARRKARS